MTQVACSSLLEGVRKSGGVVVVVDVYRAFTCTSLLFSFGVKRSILVATPEEAVALKERDPCLLLIGEVDGKPIEGFDLGNSPSQILRLGPEHFLGRTVVQRTSAGVQGVLMAMERAEEVLLGSYTTAKATTQYISSKAPPVVSIVAMGKNMKEQTPEDEWCARYLAYLLGAGEYDHREALREILFAKQTQKFLRGDKPYYPPEDPVLCLQRDIFDFSLQARREGELVVVRKRDPGWADHDRCVSR